jgi:peptide chain release factor 1
MRVLRSRLYEVESRADSPDPGQGAQVAGRLGRSQVEKIRTYNFPQNRLTDHRIGLTNHSWRW